MLPWQETKVQKEHTDPFGEAIRPGEYYFKRRTGHGFHDEVKLSNVSMDRGTLLRRSFAAGHMQWQLSQCCELAARIEAYIAEHDLEPKRHIWKADGHAILVKIQRAREKLASV